MKLKNIIFLISCYEVSIHSMQKSCSSTGSTEDLTRISTVPKLRLDQNDSNQDTQNDSIAVSLRRTCSDKEIIMMRESSKRGSSLFAPLDYTDKEVRELSKNLEGSVRKLPKALKEKDHLLSDNDFEQQVQQLRRNMQGNLVENDNDDMSDRGLEQQVQQLRRDMQGNLVESDNDDMSDSGVCVEVSLGFGDEKTKEDEDFEKLVKDHIDNSEGNKHFVFKVTMSAYVESVNAGLKADCDEKSLALIQLLSSSDEDE